MIYLLPTVFSPQGDWRQTFYNPETGEAFFCECFRAAIENKGWETTVFYPHVKYALENKSYMSGICHLCTKTTPPPKSGIDGNFLFARTYGSYIFKIMYQYKKEKSFKEAENILRKVLGYPLRGKGLISELLLFNYIKDKFPITKVIRHGKPDFLVSQHYDIWLPELHIAVEYQGEQHQRPVEYFGGEETLLTQKERDKRKRILSRKNGVKLFYIRNGQNYTPTLLNELLDKIETEISRYYETGGSP